MKPGLELDVLVATKVMGFVERKNDFGVTYLFDDPNENAYLMLDTHSEFNPSEDIEDAWMVVEKLNEMGHGVEIYTEKGFNPKVVIYGDNSKGVFDSFRGSYVLCASHGDYVPHAICLAALKAVGVEVDE